MPLMCDTTAGLLLYLVLERRITFSCRNVRSSLPLGWYCTLKICAHKRWKIAATMLELSSTSCCSTAMKYCPGRSSASSSWKITVWLVVALVWCFRWCCSTLYKRKSQLFDTDYSDAHRTFVCFSFHCIELCLTSLKLLKLKKK